MCFEMRVDVDLLQTNIQLFLVTVLGKTMVYSPQVI